MIGDATTALFNDTLIKWEAVFDGRPGVLVVVCDGHSVIVDREDVQLVFDHVWWRERNTELGVCYFRTKKGALRPELHRLIAGISDPKIRVTFRNGCCFDLRRANLTPSIWEKKRK
jgi:hypothetical protein